MSQPEILDIANTLVNLDGDKELYRELLVVFKEDAPIQLSCLKEAFKAQDVKLVERQAHTIKGAASNVGAVGVRAKASEIEMLARSGDLSRLPESMIDELKSALRSLEELLKSTDPLA